MGASLNPEFYNSAVNVHIALSPRTDLSKTYGAIIGFFWFIWALILRLVQDAGMYDLLQRESYYNDASNCAGNLFGCQTEDYKSLELERLPYYKAHMWAGQSWLSVDHNAQNAWYGKF